MGLGAAGCGYEYTRLEHKCPHLSKDGETFTCLKYRKELKKHKPSEHPIRLQKCCDDAMK